MLFSTLLLQIILEYVDRLSGFSHLFGDVRVENMKKKLKSLKDRRKGRRDGGEIDIVNGELDEKQSDSESSVSVRGSAKEVPFGGKFMRLFRRRGRSRSSAEV